MTAINRVARALIALFAFLAGQRLTAQAASLPDTVGVLIVAHGADDVWNGRVDSLAAEVGRLGARGPVAVSFLMGPAAARQRFQDQVAGLARQGARRVVVVPMLVSSHSGHYEQIRYLVGRTDSLDAVMMHHLHMGGLARPTGSTPLHLTPALDDAPELAQVLAARGKAVDGNPGSRALFLFGHGPGPAGEYALWMKHLRTVADSVRGLTGFASVVVELVRDDAEPQVRAEAVRRSRELIQLQHAATRREVVVIPILVSAGDLSRRKLPADLEGLPIVYGGEPLLPHPLIASWVIRQAAEAIRR